MTEVRFYHLTRRMPEQALPDLLLKALAAGKRVVLRTANQGECDRLNAHLWTYDEHSFLPHGAAADGHKEHQPVYLTTKAENPNGASVLMLTAPIPPDDLAGYDLVCLVFDGRSDAATAAAREFWAALKAAGHMLAYWQQNDTGSWEKK